MQPEKTFCGLEEAKTKYGAESMMRLQSSIVEMQIVDDLILALHSSGKCSIFDMKSESVGFLNESDDELIWSIFYNKSNGTIITVFILDSDDSSVLWSASIPISELRNDEKQRVVLFKHFELKWPDFIEFDELNNKIVTRHSAEGAFRIWSLDAYEFKYWIQGE